MPSAWAAWGDVDDTVIINDRADCSDGHKSNRCVWDGMPDRTWPDGPDSGGTGTGAAVSPKPARTPEQKADDVAECEKQ